MPFKKWNPGCPCGCPTGPPPGPHTCGTCGGINDIIYIDDAIAYRRWLSGSCQVVALTGIACAWNGSLWAVDVPITLNPSVGGSTPTTLQYRITCFSGQLQLTKRYRADCTGSGQAPFIITIDSVILPSSTTCEPLSVIWPSGANINATGYEL